MRILHIHTAFDTGGIETFVTALVNQIAQQGHELHVCSIFQPDASTICWNRLDQRIIRHTLGKTRRGFSLREPFAILRLIRNIRPDVVHVHGFIAYYMLSVLLFHRRIHFVYTLHSTAEKEGNQWDSRLHLIKQFFFRHGWITAVTISHESDLSFDNYYHHCPRQLIYNGIELPISAPCPKDEWLFIHAGRITEAKNQLMLCRVFRRLVKEGYPVKLQIAGELQDESIFHQMEAYLCPQIEYIGRQADIPQRMASAGAMCLPSLWEGMPITLFEALATRCIPICTAVGGIKDVITDGENGFLAEQISDESYYQALMRYIRLSVADRTRMRNNSLLTAQRYDIATTAQQYIHLYKHANLTAPIKPC